MVTFQPDLEKVAELPVVGDVARRQVAVKIQDRFWLRKFMVQPSCCRANSGENLRE
jgi:hypothetical protein